MNEKIFTVAEIAQIGFDKFSINSNDVQAFMKQIRNKIKENDIKPVGIKKTESIKNGKLSIAKNPAQAYSEDDKDKIINVLLFNYLKSQSNDEAVQVYKSQSEYERIADEANDGYNEELRNWELEEDNEQYWEKTTTSSPSFISKKEEFISEALYSIYFPKDDSRDMEQEIIQASAFATILQCKFVKDKMMALHFDFDEEGLLKDMDESYWVSSENAGSWSG
ncbi:MAG: hypothetical protein ACTJFC_01540, partial [Pseudolactococcus laudensis]